jgi:hypothetical protein
MSQKKKDKDKKVDKSVDMTFPASDAPARGKATGTEPPARPVDREAPVSRRRRSTAPGVARATSKARVNSLTRVRAGVAPARQEHGDTRNTGIPARVTHRDGKGGMHVLGNSIGTENICGRTRPAATAGAGPGLDCLRCALRPGLRALPGPHRDPAFARHGRRWPVGKHQSGRIPDRKITSARGRGPDEQAERSA